MSSCACFSAKACCAPSWFITNANIAGIASVTVVVVVVVVVVATAVVSWAVVTGNVFSAFWFSRMVYTTF